MTKIQEAALARLRAACAGKPPGSYACVIAADVSEVGKLVAIADPVNPAAVLVRSVAGLAPHEECFTASEAVAHLCELVPA